MRFNGRSESDLNSIASGFNCIGPMMTVIKPGKPATSGAAQKYGQIE